MQLSTAVIHFSTNGHGFTWVVDVLRDLDRLGKRGVVMEVRLSGKPDKKVVVNIIDQVPLDEFEMRRQKINFRLFRGRVEYNYSGGAGSDVVKIVTSLTEDDYKKMGGYRPS